METLITIQKAAEMLSVSKPTLRNWDRDKKLIAVRTPSGHRRYKLTDIEKIQGVVRKEEGGTN